LLTQYLRVHLSNKRQGTSATKTRAMVSGSGAKPWSQKGTGRARVGDKRNPLWTHGGISHGPQPKSWNLDLSKKQTKLALISALAIKAQAGKLLIVENFDTLKGKTKEAAKFLRDYKVNRNVLFLFDSMTTSFERSIANLEAASSSDVNRLNAYQVTRSDVLVATKEAILAIEKKLLQEDK